MIVQNSEHILKHEIVWAVGPIYRLTFTESKESGQLSAIQSEEIMKHGRKNNGNNDNNNGSGIMTLKRLKYRAPDYSFLLGPCVSAMRNSRMTPKVTHFTQW